MDLYLQEMLDFPKDVVEALRKKGIITFEDLRDWPVDDIDLLCESIRYRKEGIISNNNNNNPLLSISNTPSNEENVGNDPNRNNIPHLQQQNHIQNQQLFIEKPGVRINRMQEKQLKLLGYYLRHLQRTQRTFIPNEADRNRIYSMRDLYTIEKIEAKQPKPILPNKFESITMARRTIYEIDSYLRNVRGQSGVPLSYIVRDVVELRNDDDDNNNNTLVLFDTSDEDMIQRAPHSGDSYEQDLHTVWDVMYSTLYNTNGWDWIKSYEQMKNGRLAYIALKQYDYDYNALRMKIDANNALDNTCYEYEENLSSLTFTQYCTIHKQAHNDLEYYGEPIPEDQKVYKFLQGIHAPFLETAIRMIYANRLLLEDFNKCSSFLSQYVDKINMFR